MIQIKHRFNGRIIAQGESLRSILMEIKNLHYADLGGANLRDADLGGADLGGADLRGADLRGANLGGANLCCANLCDADIRGANLCDADLRDANLGNADLRGADLCGVISDETTSFFAMQCPTEGEFIAWKKVKSHIVKLRIPEDAKRSSATTRKCRASHAEVLDIQNIDGSESGLTTISHSNHAGATYTIGDVTYADYWDDDRWRECSHGIHFFITREEAVNY